MEPQSEEITLSGILDPAGNSCKLSLSADSFDLNSFAFLLSGKAGSHLLNKVSLAGEAEINLLPFHLKSAKLNIDPEPLQIGNIPIRFGPVASDTEAPLHLEAMRENEQWSLKVKASILEPFQATISMDGSARQAADLINGSGNFRLKVPGLLKARNQDQQAVSVSPELYGDFAIDIDTSSGAWQLEIASDEEDNQLSQFAKFQFQHENLLLKASAPSFTLQGQGTADTTSMDISFVLPEIQANNVTISSLAGNIPWHWPQTGNETQGEIKASSIRWKDIDLGFFEVDIKLKNMMYGLNGSYTSNLLKGVVTKVSGQAGTIGSGYYGELVLKSAITPFAAVNLGTFDHSLDKSYFSGELGLDGYFKIDPNGMKGRVQVKMQDGIFEFPQKNYEIKGINFSMLLPSLPDIRTAPAQILRFSEASIGNLAFSNGKLIWQLESKDSFFLEKGVVHWAGGRVFTNAVRISSQMKDFIVPVFCDRLKLTELLHQFGISDAEGEGTVNGRIPLLVGKDTIRFEDGFLYSSPGQGGNVKVAAFDLLSAGIPKNSPSLPRLILPQRP